MNPTKTSTIRHATLTLACVALFNLCGATWTTADDDVAGLSQPVHLANEMQTPDRVGITTIITPTLLDFTRQMIVVPTHTQLTSSVYLAVCPLSAAQLQNPYLLELRAAYAQLDTAEILMNKLN